jgi:hypothetical protein
MPVEHYNLKTMIEKTFGKKIAHYSDVIRNLTESLLGTNPRSVKRLYNSYELLNCVQKALTGYYFLNYQSALVIASLVVQMKSAEASGRIVRASTDSEALLDYLHRMEGISGIEEPEERMIADCTAKFSRAVHEIARLAPKEKSSAQTEESVLKGLSSLIRLTSVTEVSPVKVDYEQVNKADRIEIFDKTMKTGSGTEAARQCFSELFAMPEYTDAARAYLERQLQPGGIFKRIDEKRPDEFRFKCVISVNTPWEGIRIVHLGEGEFGDATLLMRDLSGFCRELGIPLGAVRWYWKDKLVYANS